MSIAAEKLADHELSPSLEIDCEVRLSAFTQQNFDFIQSLAPFGEANPAPAFLSRGVRVLDASLVGSSRQHIRMRLRQQGTTISAIAFNLGYKVNETRGPVDVVYTVGLDTWGAHPRIQLTVQDLRAAR